ncbi:hypothetical protein HMPREF0970_01322 [Schaalia odontolytica F0309]|uniref:Uncharacterized protein n=1 Tax=Schaalia odontolytica F0309 TaxID=649742 RepID=D4TZE2_9ACTO|nr:hypothetical protein HMPREF0970_01322 [Schaalia odontolytica F0309]
MVSTPSLTDTASDEEVAVAPLSVTSTASEAFQSLSFTWEAFAFEARASAAVGGAVVSPLVPEAATAAVAVVVAEDEEAVPDALHAPSASVPTRAIAPIVRAGVQIF